MNQELFEKVKNDAQRIRFSMASEQAGKKGRAFINLINSRMNPISIVLYLKDYDWPQCESACINHTYLPTYNDPFYPKRDPKIWEKAIKHTMMEYVWWKLAHAENTDKARSLPLDVEGVIG